MKIEFHYQHNFKIEDEGGYRNWLQNTIATHGFTIGPLAYIFMNDDELLLLNRKYLNHDTLTDIITFDYTEGKMLSGDIFISSDRVNENAKIFGDSFGNEMRRVMAHGALHLMGFNDKTQEEQLEMRKEEDKFLNMFHVEQ